MTAPCLLNVWNGVVLAPDKQAVRLYCCLCDWIWRCWCHGCSTKSEIVNLRSCAILVSKYTKINGNDNSSLIFFRWLYGETGIVLALDKQEVRLYCCVCAWWYWRSMHHSMRSLVLWPSWLHCPNTLQWQCVNLRSLVKCMERVSCWTWKMDDDEVRLHCCACGVCFNSVVVLVFDAVRGRNLTLPQR